MVLQVLGFVVADDGEMASGVLTVLRREKGDRGVVRDPEDRLRDAAKADAGLTRRGSAATSESGGIQKGKKKQRVRRLCLNERRRGEQP